MSESGAHQQDIWQIAHTAVRARRRDLLAVVVGQVGHVVQNGPFAGMVLPNRPSWGDGDMLPKLLGCYESELHPVLQDIIAAAPGLVVNIGAAEGYYAIGLARLLPATRVHAFDSDSTAQSICRDAAVLNRVHDRVSVTGACAPEVLEAILRRDRTPAVICDCEGYERVLINPAVVPALRSATLVVECHDFVDASITQTLADRLNPSHELLGIRESGRDPNEWPLLQGWDSLDRWLAVCEFRPRMMHWLVARPRTS